MSERLPEHFRLAPSSAERWLTCPGSLKACEGLPDDAGLAAQIGSLGHAMVEAELTGTTLADEDQAFFDSLEPEVRDRLQTDVELCVELVADLPGDKSYEQKIRHHFVEEHGGTIDVLIYTPEDRTLHVVDFKFGMLRVDVEDNPQVMCYLNLGRQLYPQATRFLGSIIQPWFEKTLQTLEFTEQELAGHELAVLEASVSDHLEAGDHCKFCPALPMCPTAAQHLKDEISIFPDLIELAAEDPSPESVELACRMYRAYKLAEKGLEGVSAILKNWASKGSNLKPHGISVSVRSRDKWVADAPERLMINGEYDGLFETTLLSPAQTRKTLKLDRDQFREKFGDLINTVESRTLIVGKGYHEMPEFDDLTGTDS